MSGDDTKHDELVEQLWQVVGDCPTAWAMSHAEDIAKIAGDALLHSPENRQLATDASGVMKLIADLGKIARVMEEHLSPSMAEARRTAQKGGA